MNDKLRGAALDRELDALLRAWSRKSPYEQPITFRSVAAALSVSTGSLYKDANASLPYPIELRPRQVRVQAAQKEQAQNFSVSPRQAVDRVWRDRLKEAQAEAQDWKSRYEGSLQIIAGLEYHVNLNGGDAARLWLPLPPNDRAARGRAPIPIRGQQRRNGAGG
jgi:hypothetical protein